MNPVASLFNVNAFPVFFGDGLAYFVMGLAITLEARRAKDSPFAMSLRALAIFGFLTGLVEWNDMFLLVQPSVSAISSSPFLQATKVILLGVSAFFLVMFGANTIFAVQKEHRWLKTLPYILLTLWCLSPLVIPHVITVSAYPASETGNSCLICHSSNAQLGIIHLGSWYPTASVAEVWARYLLYLPGFLLTAIAWWLRAREMQGVKASM